MVQYIFTDKAEVDLENIVDYTNKNWGELQANKYIDELEEISQTLAENPEIGAKRDLIYEGLRSFPYKSHIIYYTKVQQGIAIIRVLHSNMDSANHL